MKRILIADDDAAILDVMTIVLEDEGFEVVAICDGDVISKIEEVKPDLVLLDLWMSGRDGVEITRGLKNNITTSAIPVVVVSARHDLAEVAKDIGADAYLNKPFDIETLASLVRKRLE
ncbi:MAG: response regulator [bacterium]|nr:response regulator [bacterium]